MSRTQASTTTIRRASTADLPRLGRLGALLVEEHHHFDERRFLPTRDRTPADYAAFLVRQLADPHVIVLVADDHGDVVGYAYATIEGYDYMALRGPAAVIQDIIVDRNSAVAGLDDSCCTPCSSRFARAAHHKWCCRRQSGTRRRSVCSRAPAFAEPWSR